jgi:hypothetical protein
MTGMPESHPICEGKPTSWFVCTCGSGGHPRRCKEHPGAYEEHLRELEAVLEWDQDAPDHWSAEVPETNLRVSVWQASGGEWVWELWDMARDPDKPRLSGWKDTFEKAQGAAEAGAALALVALFGDVR